MKDFAFTVKFLGDKLKHCNAQDYWEIFEQWCALDSDVDIIDHVFENNEEGDNLHVHGIIQLPDKFYRKKLSIQGMHFKLDEIFDRDGWIKYINKINKEDPSSDIDSDNSSISSHDEGELASKLKRTKKLF